MAETKKKRERIEDGEDRDLKRVAEIVLVLEAMGQMRGGKDPTDFERGLAVEARHKLVEICASSAKPNDLFSTDSARVLAADLGFSSVKDRMGNRPTKKISIVEKLAITKKKMQEMKESIPQQIQQPSPFQPVGMLSKPENRGSSIQESSRTPSFHTSALTSSSGRPTHFIETPLRQPSVPLEKDSSMSTPVHVQMGGHFRMDTRPSGQLFGSHAQGNRNTDKMSSIPPASSLSTVVSKPSPITKLIDHTPKKFDSTRVNSFQSPQVFKDQGSRNFAVHPIHGSTGSVQQHSNIFNTLQSSLLTNHGDISRVLQGVLPRNAIDSSGWNPPSVEYMNKLLNCQVCKITITDTESLLVCDACERGVHLRCLKTFSQKSVSYIEWHCPQCLLSSNGKSWAPKYGKVTRNMAVSKSSSNAGVVGSRVPSEKENLGSKVNNQKIASNMNSSSSNCTHSHVADGHLQSIQNKKAPNPGEKLNKDSPLASLQAAGAPCRQTNTNNLKENDISVCTDHVKPCKNSSQYEINDELVSCTVNVSTSGSSEPKVVSTYPVEVHTDVSDAFNEVEDQLIAQNDDGLDEWINELSGNPLKEIGKCADEEIDQYSEFREMSNSKTLFVHDTVSIFENSHQEIINVKNPHLEIGKCINEGLKEQSKFPDTCSKSGQERISHSNSTVDILCETKVHNELQMEHLYGVKWIGDALDNVDKKTYYQSCCINDLVYNLQDIVLIRFKKHGISPSKLQVLWEDNQDGSKWAAVSQYYFPKDIPDCIIQPSSPENEEVYESNDSITIDASCIHGPCIVLPWLMFQEERERRSSLIEGDNSTCPIFLCRWSYDKSKSSFQPRVC